MDPSARRLLTRCLLVVMFFTALLGGWVIAKHGGRRGRIGKPPAAVENQPKHMNNNTLGIFNLKGSWPSQGAYPIDTPTPFR